MYKYEWKLPCPFVLFMSQKCQNVPKWPKMSQNRSKSGKNDPKSRKNDPKMWQKWPKIDQNVPKFQKRRNVLYHCRCISPMWTFAGGYTQKTCLNMNGNYHALLSYSRSFWGQIWVILCHFWGSKSLILGSNLGSFPETLINPFTRFGVISRILISSLFPRDNRGIACALQEITLIIPL